ncbi:hypothetical protein LINGRAHAP2_LOCUS2610 [Linum grandiflorum]
MFFFWPTRRKWNGKKRHSQSANQSGKLKLNLVENAMPGPGAHLMYAMGSGVGLTTLTGGRFTPHHTLIYTVNAFLGPDIGSFSDWLSSFFPHSSFFSLLLDYIHHPFYYILLLGFPFSLFYSWLSHLLLRRKLLDSISGVPLPRRQCFFLIAAGSLSHFFLDHLFEEPCNQV